jgi:hypothetical protein
MMTSTSNNYHNVLQVEDEEVTGTTPSSTPTSVDTPMTESSIVTELTAIAQIDTKGSKNTIFNNTSTTNITLGVSAAIANGNDSHTGSTTTTTGNVIVGTKPQLRVQTSINIEGYKDPDIISDDVELDVFYGNNKKLAENAVDMIKKLIYQSVLLHENTNDTYRSMVKKCIDDDSFIMEINKINNDNGISRKRLMIEYANISLYFDSCIKSAGGYNKLDTIDIYVKFPNDVIIFNVNKVFKTTISYESNMPQSVGQNNLYKIFQSCVELQIANNSVDVDNRSDMVDIANNDVDGDDQIDMVDIENNDVDGDGQSDMVDVDERSNTHVPVVRYYTQELFMFDRDYADSSDDKDSSDDEGGML